MATTVWIHANFARNSVQALTENASVPAISPLLIRLKSSQQSGVDEDFQLPYNPIQVRYGSLSDEIAQISRPGTTPIVAFKAHRLMTVDFSFILAYPGDGLSQSVDKEIATLRKFAASSDRVIQLINFDSLTNSPFPYRNKSQERFSSGLFFSIVELNIESIRRNKNNQITQANVTLSLVENRNPRINPTFIPPLRPTVPNPKCDNPQFAKNNPNKCRKKPVATPRRPSATSANDASADAVLDSEKIKCYYDIKNMMICPP